MSKFKGVKIPIKIFTGKMVKLTKLSDDVFEGNHPNKIYEGYEKEGVELEIPKVDERYYVGQWFSTSPIKEIINKNLFKTLYSTYKLDYIDGE